MLPMQGAWGNRGNRDHLPTVVIRMGFPSPTRRIAEIIVEEIDFPAPIEVWQQEELQNLPVWFTIETNKIIADIHDAEPIYLHPFVVNYEILYPLVTKFYVAIRILRHAEVFWEQYYEDIFDPQRRDGLIVPGKLAQIRNARDRILAIVQEILDALESAPPQDPADKENWDGE